MKTLNITDKTGKVVSLLVVKDEDDLMIINKSGTAIRMHIDEIRNLGRNTQGTKVIELKKRNDQISHVCVVPRDDEKEDEENPAEESSNNASNE